MAAETEVEAPVEEAYDGVTTTDVTKSQEPTKNDTETETAATSDEEKLETADPKAIVSSSKRSRPAYKYDPSKITLRFLFANHDGLTVTIECEPSDTVGEVKGALLSVWPNDFPNCSGGEFLRLVCMGKGYLMPDTRTLEDCQIPVFKTHPTPVNVSVKPYTKTVVESKKKAHDHASAHTNRTPAAGAAAGSQVGQGCGCIIL